MPRKPKLLQTETITDGLDVVKLREKFHEDFFFFAAMCFPNYVSSPFAEFHRDQHDVISSNRTKKALIAPRGHGKSTFELLEAVWHLLERDNHYFIFVGNSVDKAKQNFILPMMREFETNSLLRAVYGDVIGDIWGMDGLEFVFKDNTGAIVDRKLCKPFGVGQSLRGTRYLQYRPDYILADDIEDDEQVKNAGRREEIKKYFYEQVYPALDKQGDVYSDTVFGGTPKMIITGTILHYDSFLINLMSPELKDVWDVRKWSCIYDDENGKRRSLWDTRYSVEYWDNVREVYKKEGRERSFRQEYMNEVMSDDDREIPIDKIRYYTQEEIKDKDLIKYTSVDIALSSDAKSMADNHRDYNAIVTIGCEKASGKVFVLEIVRFKTTDIMQTITEAMYAAIRWQPRFVIYERAGLQTMFETLFRNEMIRLGKHFILKPISHGSKRKEDRIKLSVKTLVEREMLYLLKGTDGTTQLYEEIYTFPLGKHDDILDALSYAIFGSEQKFSFAELKETKEKVEKKVDEVWQRMRDIIKAQDEEDSQTNNSKYKYYNY